MSAEAAAPHPWPDFAAFLAFLTGERGYTAHPCAAHCPDHEGREHAHLSSADGDLIVWADGTWSTIDLTRPAKLIYPTYARRRF